MRSRARSAGRLGLVLKAGQDASWKEGADEVSITGVELALMQGHL